MKLRYENYEKNIKVYERNLINEEAYHEPL